MVSERIKTEHSARLRLVHGEDCEGCQDIGLRMALHIVHLAGWRIVRAGADQEDLDDDPESSTYGQMVCVIDVVEEWLPDGDHPTGGDDGQT